MCLGFGFSISGWDGLETGPPAGFSCAFGVGLPADFSGGWMAYPPEEVERTPEAPARRGRF